MTTEKLQTPAELEVDLVVVRGELVRPPEQALGVGQSALLHREPAALEESLAVVRVASLQIGHQRPGLVGPPESLQAAGKTE